MQTLPVQAGMIPDHEDKPSETKPDPKRFQLMPAKSKADNACCCQYCYRTSRTKTEFNGHRFERSPPIP